MARNGYLTWEWKIGLRSYFYPSIFVVLFKVLRWLRLDSRESIVMAPRVVQALFSAIGDLFTVRLSTQLFGKRAGNWTAFSLATSWFLFFCGSRTLGNTMEMSLTVAGLFYYHSLHARFGRSRRSSSDERAALLKYLAFLGACVITRPTAAVQWAPLCAHHLFKERRRLRNWLTYAFCGLIIIAVATIIDYAFYGRFVCTACNFIRFNAINGLGSFYGTHPWHWYWTQGFWTILGSHLVPFVLAARRSFSNPMFLLIIWQIAIYSCLSHKEFRFLLPVLPLCHCFIGRYLSLKNRPHFMASFLVVTSLPLAMYTGIVHQRGTLDVVRFLAEEQEAHRNVTSIAFLMPCHSTPLYSHLHYEIPTEFLTCEPNLDGDPASEYMDEADRFHSDPEGFLISKYSNRCEYPSHVVLFDRTAEMVPNFLMNGNYSLRSTLFHAHVITDGRVGNRVQVYHRLSFSSMTT